LIFVDVELIQLDYYYVDFTFSANDSNQFQTRNQMVQRK